MKVFGGVLVLGRVATGSMSTDQAQAQVYPSVADLNAVFADVLVGMPYFNLIEVGAFFGHASSVLRVQH